ncbi:MAG TPA: beta-ketoacyl synthase chain length factor [Steroidobacteraceae bacterium]|nr:beta-ketoacyl synthase chain length factor [Steroidobacteraceae bacterium]HVC02624.1 beta-ketoacyl synthase chain length factor [Steroidobacteraceae bacterium]
MTLGACIEGVGLLGPGLEDWATGAAVLAGERPYLPAPTALPAPSILPAAERRRSGASVRLALAVGLQASRHAGADPRMLGSVFASSGADGANCHEICVALADSRREMSPTRFTNSVHNAASGYWSIAVGCMQPSQVLCAYDASFAAGLLEALVRVSLDAQPILLVVSDTQYPEPLHAKRPIADAFGVGLVLSARCGVRGIAWIEATLESGEAETLPQRSLETLRTTVPAARALPLLAALASQAPRRATLEYLGGMRLGVDIRPCS